MAAVPERWDLGSGCGHRLCQLLTLVLLQEDPSPSGLQTRLPVAQEEGRHSGSISAPSLTWAMEAHVGTSPRWASLWTWYPTALMVENCAGWQASWRGLSFSPSLAGFPEGKHPCCPGHRGGKISWSRINCIPKRSRGGVLSATRSPVQHLPEGSPSLQAGQGGKARPPDTQQQRGAGGCGQSQTARGRGGSRGLAAQEKKSQWASRRAVGANEPGSEPTGHGTGRARPAKAARRDGAAWLL